MTVVSVTVLLWARGWTMYYLEVTFKQHFCDLRSLCNFCLIKQPKKKRISSLPTTLAYAEKNHSISLCHSSPSEIIKNWMCNSAQVKHCSSFYTGFCCFNAVLVPTNYKGFRSCEVFMYENDHLSQNSTTNYHNIKPGEFIHSNNKGLQLMNSEKFFRHFYRTFWLPVWGDGVLESIIDELT